MAIHAIPQAADLYGDIEATPKARPRDYLPGLTVAVLATLAAASLADRYGAPLTLMALLIGLALNFLSADRRLTPGLGLAARELLRWAIVLVGARVTLGQIVAIGPEALAVLVATVGLTILAGVAAARALGLKAPFGVLAGGAVAICGGSAALAISATLGERRVPQASLTLVLVGISTASSLAMVLYPGAAHLLGFSDAQAGFFLGAAIHDVAQTVGAGYSWSAPAGDTAIVIKLARVAMLAPVLAGVAMLFPGESNAKGKVPVLPWFVAGFFIVAAVNSTGIVPRALATGAADIATWLLAVAVAATAIRSPLGEILKSGPKPLFVVGAASAASFVLALTYAWGRIG
ncbi:hypothetical protein IP88_07335 [alpha proteobacterium AAP81b]|nr:hypothetical protein IP88_07335 [alpha proteobacterium AAP81b]